MLHKTKTKNIFLLTLLAVLLLTGSALAWESGGEDGGTLSRVIVLYEDSADRLALNDAISRLDGVELVWDYDVFFSGAAADASPAGQAALKALPGVADVRPARSYNAPLSGSEDPASTDNGLSLMGADKLWEQGYTGDGTVIAVLDTGLLTSHEAFADDSLMSSPAITRADVEAFIAAGGSAGRYISKRIPFAYDYHGKDNTVNTTNSHGTHVTALAAGYAVAEDGSVRFRGSAPGAQILSMKIFPNGSGGGTNDSIILRALEDAWELGADVVNISVGTGGGFAEDQLLDGLYSRTFARMAEAGVIICCAAGNEDTYAASKSWQPQLPTAAYTDYGTNCAPSSYRGATAVGAAAISARTGQIAPADYSSWGPASDLHLTPALLAFGGPAVSAGVSGNDAYRSDYGTSMASPAAAGMFASLLQVLRERGVTDKNQAADLARGLLESTARVLTDVRGVPVSPRKQGAGFVDLSAAASSGLAVVAPLLELGESETGEFVLKLTLHNFTKNSINAKLDVTVLTDAYADQDGVYYSLLAARDITDGVTVGGTKSVTVPAGGEASVSLPLKVGAALRQELAAVFTNGFYVEGFVNVTGGGQSVHAAFLGYCGDWGAVPVLGALDFRDVQDAWFRMAEQSAPWSGRDIERAGSYLSELRADMGANVAFIAKNSSARLEDGRLLGTNGHAYALHDDARLSMPARGTDAGVVPGSILRVDLYAQRSAAGIVMVVSDRSTGAIYYADDETWVERSLLDSYSKAFLPAASFAWDGTDASGAALPGGTEVRVDVYAWLDTDELPVAAYGKNRQDSAGDYGWLLDEAYSAYRELSFPLTLDGKAPAVSAGLADDKLTLTFRDDQYLAYAAVRDRRGVLLSEEAFFPKAAGESGKIELGAGWRNSDTLYIRVEDYAGNTAGYALDVKALAAGETAEAERCAVLLLEDAELSAWYHDAVDYVLRGEIMEAADGVQFRPDEEAARSEIVKALYQANGRPASGLTVSDLPFSDVSGRASYGGALCWAYENGVIAGQTDTTFAGSSDVSRQELAVMLWRCARLNGTLGGVSGSLRSYPDRGSVAGWAEEAMTWAVSEGIITGQDGKLNPEGPVTRAQAAQMLVRFLEK